MTFAGYQNTDDEDAAIIAAAKGAADTNLTNVTVAPEDGQTFGAKDSEGNPQIQEGAAVTSTLTTLKAGNPGASYALAVLNTAKTQLDSKLP